MLDREWMYGWIRLLAVGAIAIALAGVTGCSSDSELTAAQHIERAKAHQDENDYRAALIELKNAAQKEPDNREARWLLGEIYLKFEHGPAAEKELRRAAELGVAREAIVVPLGTALLLQGKRQDLLTGIVTDSSFDKATNARIEVLRSKAYIGGSDFDKAQQAVDAATALAPELVSVRVAQARMDALHGKIDAAKQQVRATLEQHPEAAEAWSFLADLERWQNNYEDAERAYTKAIESREYTDTSDRYNRLMVRIARKDFEHAREDIKLLKSLGRNWAGLSYAQGLLDYYEKRYPEAQIHFEKALTLDERHIASNFFLGATHYMQQHWQQADRYLARALSAAPGLSDARLLLASVRLQARQFEEARDLLQPLIEKQPEDPVLLRMLGNIAMRVGATGQGVEYARRLVAVQPQSGDAHLQLAQALLASGQQKPGMEALQKALELSPDLAPAEALLAISELRAGNAQKALEIAQRLRDEQPDAALPLNLIGAAQSELGRTEEAKKAFEQAFKAAPGNVETANNLARLALAEGDARRTEEVYRDILGKNPGHLFTLLSMAELEARRGRTEQANELLRQAIDKHPTALRPRLLLARYHLRAGAPDKSVALLSAVRAHHGDDRGLLKTLGEAQMALGRGAQAVETFRELVRVWPDSVIPRYLLANALGATGDWEGMRRGLEQVLKAQPDYKDARLAMVRLEALTEHTDRADALLAQLKQDHPDDADVLGLEGWLLSASKRFDAAAKAYEKALAKTPRSDWMISMARAYWLAGDQQRAIARLKEWNRGHPYDLDARYALGSMLFANDDTKDAVALYREILDLDGNQVVALNNLAALLRESEPASATRYAERAFELAPELLEVRDTYAALLLDQGRHEQALRLLRDAAQNPAAPPAMRLHLAQAYAKTGDTAAARAVLERLVRQEPQFAERDQALQLLSGLKDG